MKQIASIWKVDPAVVSENQTKVDQMANGEPVPQHPFEVRITIGAEDWDYVIRTLDELARHIPEHGPDCNMCSGGAGGSHSVTVVRRDISPEDFRKELAAWHDRFHAVRRTG